MKENTSLTGILTRDGSFYPCGWMGHAILHKKLYDEGKTNDYNWTTDTTIFHVSSGTLNAPLSYALMYGECSMGDITDEQLSWLWKNRTELEFYNEYFIKVPTAILNWVSGVHASGSKYGNLMFLKKYTDIKTPNLSNLPEFKKTIIRSSPTKSFPGVLFSEIYQSDSIERLCKKWNEIPEEIRKNENLHWFYQEYVEGRNGVANIQNGKFTYSVGKQDGDIVGGKSGVKVSKKTEKVIIKLGDKIKNLFPDESLQLEFVITDDDIYVVQIRVLKNTPKEETNERIKKVRLTGKTFSSYIPFGKWSCSGEITSKNEILVVDSDCEDPTKLFGKKLLIVRNQVEFSHILALSKALNIPSLYGIGDVEIPDKFKFDLTSETAYII